MVCSLWARSRSRLQLDLDLAHILFKSNGQTMYFHHSNTRMKVFILQGGNSNLDCVPRTAVVAMSDGGEGEGGVLSSNFVHQMCPLPPTPPGGTSGGQSWN